MTFARLISKAVWHWQVWRMRCERERAYPELKAHRLRKEQCRHGHRKGAADSAEAARAVLHASMQKTRIREAGF